MPKYLNSLLAYMVQYTRCNSSHIGDTCRRWQIRIDEHIRANKIWSFYKHLHENKKFLNSFTFDCFFVLDTAQTEYQLKMKEGMYIHWNKNLIIWQLHVCCLTFLYIFSDLFHSHILRPFFIYEVYLLNTHPSLSISDIKLYYVKLSLSWYFN